MNVGQNFLSHPARIVSGMELITDNPPTAVPIRDKPRDDSAFADRAIADRAFADRVFADPVGYLASQGIGSRLVSVTGMSTGKAA
jgi:hypothetical protein